ncbi:MAG: Gfo/Idh/MocA family oxidoreductase [Armatimonadetes bacterium]|nr:Gfo/Idh/MocA family oxidoreductase [Armatimonadota bacterium]
MLRIGLAGAGTLGGDHARNFAHIDGCEIAVVFDVVKPSAERLAREIGAEVAECEDRLYADDIDVVVITTPTPFHADYCIKAAKAGKHIFCEKPLARTLQQGEAVLEAVRDAGVTFMVGHVLRFMEPYPKARELVQGGAIGRVGMVRMSRINTIPGGPDSWFRRYDMSGGVIFDMSIHDLDWLLWTFGPAERVMARSLYKHMPTLDYGLMSIRMKSGVIAHVEGSWADLGLFRTSFEIAGSGGLIAHDSTRNVTLTVQKRGDAAAIDAVQRPSSPAPKSPYLLEDEHFIECVREHKTPLVTPEDAFEAMRLALACCQSAETGQVVRL